MIDTPINMLDEHETPTLVSDLKYNVLAHYEKVGDTVIVHLDPPKSPK